MQKYLKAIALTTLLCFLTACSPSNITDGLSVMLGKKQVATEPAFVTAPSAPPDSLHTLSPDENFDDGGYYYKHLSDIEKAVYQSLYKCVAEYNPEAELYDVLDSQIIKIYKSIIFDHPEIFYVDGYQLEKYEGSTKIIFQPHYIKRKEDLPEIQKRLDEYGQKIMAEADTSTDFTTLRSIYDYIITHTRYNLTATELANICSVAINGDAVCDGYAKATMYYCNKAGIECIVVPGYIRSNGTAHLWNAVKINDLWYFVDTTWGDEDFENERNTPEVRYDYLCVSQQQINGTHQVEDFIAPPMCSSNEANYYYQTGRVLSALDGSQLSSVFSGIETNRSIAFACSDQQVYQQAEDYLIMQKHIFDYLPSKKMNIGYVTNPNVMSFTFWIQD